MPFTITRCPCVDFNSQGYSDNGGKARSRTLNTNLSRIALLTQDLVFLSVAKFGVVLLLSSEAELILLEM